MRTFDATGLEILDAVECLRLLGTVPVGRLVFTQGGLPVIRLVDYRLDDETIVLACDDCEWLRAAYRGDIVAFEVDAVEQVPVGPDRRWTVTAVGHLSVMTGPDVAELGWPAGLSGRQLLRVGTESLSGRRTR